MDSVLFLREGVPNLLPVTSRLITNSRVHDIQAMAPGQESMAVDRWSWVISCYG
ncbi:hypothetical protein BRADI_1g62855v3 [Brachypodium distachyon]|uniref:Uncharacterized protein n=1 Tax=Brachypodium distachyon TaxID=15368 RepID=A0A0Q3LFM6_BRADI|nr:hypothetical protein BRADI_1g62855v3 [Brachypodium distachyon]